MASAACKRGSEGVRCLQARPGRRRCVPLRALALAELTSSSDTNRRTATKRALRDGLASLLLLSVGAAASAPPSTSGSEEREASSAPPSPSRHDPWRFLRCVWICVIAIAIPNDAKN